MRDRLDGVGGSAVTSNASVHSACRDIGAVYIGPMAPLLFRCPTTRMIVQHGVDDDEEDSKRDYEGVTCEACTGVHFVNRKGEVLGSDER